MDLGRVFFEEHGRVVQLLLLVEFDRLTPRERGYQREQRDAKHAAKRAELRKRLNDANVSIEEKIQIQEKFAKLPRNSCSTRLNRRCEVTGRSKSYYRKFGISRIALRDLTLRGQLPGMRKSSW